MALLTAAADHSLTALLPAPLLLPVLQVAAALAHNLDELAHTGGA